MKRLLASLLFALALLAPSVAPAQFGGCPPGFCSPPATVPSGCTESGHAAAFLARAGSLDATHTAAYTALLNGLETDGLTCKLDLLYIYATQTSAAAALNLLSTNYTPLIVGTPTFTPDQGFTSTNGSSTSYLNTGFNPTAAVATSQMQQNDSHISVWSLTPTTHINASFGAADTSLDSHYYIFPKYSDNNQYDRINSGGAGGGIGGATVPIGHFGSSRSGFNMNHYQNGTYITTSFSTSQPVINLPFYSSATNSLLGPSGSDLKLAAVTVGAFLTTPQWGSLYSRICTYMGAINALGGCPPACAESTAFIARTSGLTTARQNAYHGLICSLVADGIWAKLDALYVFATVDAATARLSLVSSTYDITVNGAPTFTADRGYTGTAGSTTIYLDTNFNPSTASSPKYVQDSAHLSSWSLTNAGFNNYNIGNYDGSTSAAMLSPRQLSDTQSYFHIQAAVAGFADGVLGDPRGFFVGTRDDSANIRAYYNGVFHGLSTRTSTAVNNLNMYILGHNAAGTAAGNGQQQAMASIGSELSAGDAANFYTRLRTYMTTVGVP